MTLKEKLYKSERWQKISKHQRIKEPLCRTCLKEYGKLTAGKVADHIIPWETVSEFYNNELQTLCYECHQCKTYMIDYPNKKKKKLLEPEFF